MSKKTLSSTMVFVLLFGLISMLSDVTKESASSIHGAFLSLLGASAATIGFISGLGELVGNSLRYLTGILADRTKKYWTLVIIGSIMELAAVPLLALLSEDGWIYACILLIVQKLGKAVKKPAKDTIASFAAADAGAGKTFGMMELLDQFGSVLGPAMLTLIMLFKTDGSTFERYSYCFGMLAIPAALTMLVLLYTCYKYPNPADFEKSKSEGGTASLKIGRNFLLFIAGTSFFAFGFINYSIVAMHVSRVFPDEIGPDILPLLYSGAMLIDALAAVVFGVLYDKFGSKILVLSAVLSAPFALLIFLGHSLPALCIGIGMWGVGMGAQESILKAVVTQMTPKESRATSFGLFSVAFGFAWFAGSWTLGWLYDTDITLMIIVSVLTQILAIPFYVMSGKKA